MKIVFLQIRWTENCYYYYYFSFLEFLIDKQKEKGNRLLRIFLIFVFFLYNSDLSRKKLSSFGKVIETIFIITISMGKVDWERSSQPEPPAGDTGERSALSELCTRRKEIEREVTGRASHILDHVSLLPSFFFFSFLFPPVVPFIPPFSFLPLDPRGGDRETKRRGEERTHLRSAFSRNYSRWPLAPHFHPLPSALIPPTLSPSLSRNEVETRFFLIQGTRNTISPWNGERRVIEIKARISVERTRFETRDNLSEARNPSHFFLFLLEFHR